MLVTSLLLSACLLGGQVTAPTFEPAPIFSLLKPVQRAGQASPIRDQKLRILSYNIRHCAGTDDKLDVARTADAIKTVGPDFVGLQEVDKEVGRSESVNQPSVLGKKLGMDAAFGSFMDFDGGEYGLAVLSKHPLRSARSLRLPAGNEPRVALFAEAVLPDGQTITLVNVHFDWVDDDGFRFSQASHLAEVLKSLKTPFVLLGDFNDEPGSRTIKLFRSMAQEAKKPSGDHFTFSSIKPEKEIDFIFASPAARWKVGTAKVLNVPVVSDHRPVEAELILRGPSGRQ